MSDSKHGASANEDDLKQNLNEDLSQIVHDYESRGLSAPEIVDSLVWHGEVAISRAGRSTTIDDYLSN